MKNTRNSLLELFRFVFCFIVLGFHFGNMAEVECFHAGYLGVEFFFITAGFFIAAHYEKRTPEITSFVKGLKEIKNYTDSRVIRLYPLYVLALFSMVVVKMIEFGFHQALTSAKNSLAEFFLLQWTPLGNEVLISPDWFVPSVFFGGILAFVMLLVFRKWGGLIIAPIVSLLIYGYYFRLIGKIDVIVSYHAILRGIAGLMLGIFVYYLYALTLSKFEKCEEQWISPIIASIIFVGIFVYSNFGHRSKIDFLIIALYAIGIYFLMIGKKKLPDKVEKVFLFLGKSTYPVYLFHVPLFELVLHLIKK